MSHWIQETFKGHTNLCLSILLACDHLPTHSLAVGQGPTTHPTSSSSGSGGSGELGERSRSRTEGLLRIQARQIGYSGVFSLN